MDSTKLAAALVKGLKGIEVRHRAASGKEREAQRVFIGKRLVAEALVNKRFVRLNFRDALPKDMCAGRGNLMKEATATSSRGGDSFWKGGALVVTDENRNEARGVLEAYIAGQPQ